MTKINQHIGGESMTIDLIERGASSREGGRARSSNRRRWSQCTAALAIALAASPAVAQQAEPQPGPAEQDSATSSGAELETIVVTARRREENLQTTPVTVTAMTEAMLEEREITTVADVGRFTPNVQFDATTPISGSSNSASIFIRGIGQTDYTLTIDPGVGVFLDGVYISRSVGAVLDTADVSRIEILRGPQGTLFGKNTIGGAVVVTSKRPGSDFGGELELTTGAYDRVDLRGSLNIPVSESFKMRASAALQTRDGYVTRLIDGGRMGNRNSLSGRLIAVYEPSDRVDFTFSADVTRSREQSPGLVLLSVNENALFPRINNTVLNPASVCGPTVPTRLTNDRCYTSRWLPPNRYSNYDTGVNQSDTDIWGASLTGNFELGSVNLKSITAYRELDSFFGRDADHSPLVIVEATHAIDQQQFSQEFQLSGELLGDRLNWLAGAFYMDEKGSDINDAKLAGAGFQSGGAISNDSYALFAQATFAATDALRITGGVRQTWEKKRFLPDQFITIVDPRAAPFLPPNRVATPPRPLRVGDRLLPFEEVSSSFKKFTPSVSVDYRITPDVFAFATYSRGFKGGGFTQRVFPPETATPTFEPETANNYEVGLKTTLLNRRLRFNAAAFQTDYDDLQVTVIEGFAPKFRNAGKARIRGVETEFELIPVERLRLSGGVGYLDAKYLSVDPRAAPVTVNSKLVNTPEWTVNLASDLSLFSFGGGGEVKVRGDYTYRSEMFRDAVNNPQCRARGSTLVGASLAVTAPGERWSGTLGATNLTNEQNLQSCYVQNAGGYAEGSFSRPREWYLRLGYRF
jgi:iron complex outermembrane receptor protein